MVKSDFVGIDYPTLQTVIDLRDLALSFPAPVHDRLLAGVLVADAKDRLHRILKNGCRLAETDDMALHPALVLAATLPDDDFEAFLFATAMLLADRLQNGLGPDDLFWHWDGFRPHYRIAQLGPRVAIMQGFRRAQILGRIALYDPPEPFELQSATEDAVIRELDGLGSDGGDMAEAARAVLAGQRSAQDLAELWEEATEGVPPAVARAVRHVYELFDDWIPYRDTVFDPSGPFPPLLPSLAFQPT